MVSEVDKYIKTKVVGDALDLMLESKYRNDRSKVKSHGCWKRILPSGEEDEFMTFCKAKYLYERLLNRTEPCRWWRQGEKTEVCFTFATQFRDCKQNNISFQEFIFSS